MLLRLIPKKLLWKEIMRREGFSGAADIEGSAVWQDVYGRTPLLAQWLRRRENALLASTVLQDRSRDFLLGQIAENKLYQRFDGKGHPEPKVEKKDEVRLPSRTKFLEGWKKNNANTDEKVHQQDAGNQDGQRADAKS